MTKKSILLIHPPINRACQPPTGIPRLQYALKQQGITCHVIDANLEGLLYLLNKYKATYNRASATPERNLELIWSGTAFTSMNRYTKCMRELNRSLVEIGKPNGWQLSLTDIKHSSLSPLRSQDLISHSVKYETNPFHDYYQNQLIPKIKELNPEVIGISLIYLSQALCAFALIGMIRRHFPDIKIILGGGLITSWMTHPEWDNPFNNLVDDCVKGPGEAYLLNLFQRQANTGRSIGMDFSDFPITQYLSPGFILPFATSLGCYWKQCQFCPETYEDSKFIPTPPDQVIQNLTQSIKQTNPILIHLTDNAIPPNMLRYLASHSLPVPWYGHVRFEKDLKDSDFCQALYQSGCRMLQLGLESGSQAVLDRMSKGIVLESVTRILNNLKDAGIGTYVYVLFGTPDETRTDAELTLQYILKHHKLIQWISPAIFNLPRFSPEAAQLKTRPFYEGDLALYLNFEHPHGWHRRDVRLFLNKSFKAQPAIKKILRRTPSVFTSNHAPFFYNTHSFL